MLQLPVSEKAILCINGIHIFHVACRSSLTDRITSPVMFISIEKCEKIPFYWTKVVFFRA